MSRNRRRYNNMLILLVVGLGFLLLATGRLTEQHNSTPLLPPQAQIQSLVFADALLEYHQGQWHSKPSLNDSQRQALLQAWQSAQLVPVAEPAIKPVDGLMVDVYLQGGSGATSVLLYPSEALIKIHGQPQWWRLVNQAMPSLIVQGEP